MNKRDNLCQTCNALASAKRTLARKKERDKLKPKKEFVNLEPFYKSVWESLPHFCYETGQPIYSYHNWNIHHLLEKKDYPEHTLNTDVCVILTLEAHSRWHTLPPSKLKDKMPKCWAKLQELKQKYNII